MAVPGSDDTGMLIAASVISPGYFHPEVGLLYRKWSGQGSAKTPHHERIEWQTRMSLISERADAIKVGRWIELPVTPAVAVDWSSELGYRYSTDLGVVGAARDSLLSLPAGGFPHKCWFVGENARGGRP